MTDLLKELTMAKGIPAHEGNVRDIMKKHMKDFADISYDNIGSIIGKKEGSSHEPIIMAAGHMDEIGFIVSEITKEGYIKFIPAGGWWGHVVLSQQFEIITDDKKTIRGVVGSKPPHILEKEERKKVVKIKDMYLDIGVNDKEEAKEKGIKTGDMIVPYIEYTPLANPKYLLAKAFDDRAGAAVVVDVMRKLKDIDHPNTYCGVGTVQEEVGLRGATTAANTIEPDIGIALDVTIAHDYPGGSNDTKLGKGPCIMVYDSSMVGHVGLRKFAENIAEKNDIPYQLTHLTRGGTDAGKIHIAGSGSPSIAICLPCRYLHSHTSVIHQDDYDNTVRLVTQMIQELDADTVETITYG